VVDAQGLAIPGATVVITGPTGSQTLVTDSEGRFIAPFLRPATYSVRVELQGFRPVTIEDVDVALNERTFLPNITLRVGELTEQVEWWRRHPRSTHRARRLGRTSRRSSSIVSRRSGA
jgi:hypothetical protein